MSLWRELKRRQVIGAGLAYVIFAVAAAEAADIFLPALGFPYEAVTAVLVVLLAGFPIALVLAWVYDMRIVRERPAPGELATLRSLDRRGAATAGRTSSDGRPSLAVLPFANMSSEPDSQFFCEGVVDDILTHLSRVRGLRVTSRTSVLQYKGTTKTVPEIAEELGVDSLLEGSIRIAGSKVRITVQLIDASRDDHLWAESFDRPLQDVLAIQSEVAESVARALRAQLSPSEIDQLHAVPTQNVEAYRLCLLGEASLGSWATGDLDRAVEHFEAAIELDPNYARAHAGLAMVLSIIPAFSGRSSVGLLGRMEVAARRALELDDELPLAQAAYAMLLAIRYYDWTGSAAAIERAVELAPHDPYVRGTQATLLLAQGSFDEAFAALDQAEAEGEESAFGRAMRVSVCYSAGRIEEGLQVAEDGLRDFPDNFFFLWQKGASLAHLERYEEAVEWMDRALEVDPHSGLAVAARAVYLVQLGRVDEARSEVVRLENMNDPEPAGPWALAFAYLGLGDVERALDLWEQAVRERHFTVPFLRITPRLRRLRAHPRFQAILQVIWPDHGPFEVNELPEAPFKGGRTDASSTGG